MSGAEACETEEALQALYDEKYEAMDAVKAYKQTLVYLDLPSSLIAAEYGWIEGDVFDVTMYTGSVEKGLVEFDKSLDKDTVINESVGDITKAQNWKWFISRENGVIVAYKAKTDCKITVTDTRLKDGGGSNGWTDDCVLTSYIVRDGVAKKINSINAPSSDADFSGTYYAKAGDMIYIEFNTFTADAGSQRNTESPYATTAEADSTAFDEEAYAQQNHDLPAEVTERDRRKDAGALHLLRRSERRGLLHDKLADPRAVHRGLCREMRNGCEHRGRRHQALRRDFCGDESHSYARTGCRGTESRARRIRSGFAGGIR